jgi:hypothetical protein
VFKAKSVLFSNDDIDIEYVYDETKFESSYRIWPDELASNMLSTKTIFNLFERARSDILGGPSALEELMQSSVHIYVARVNNYKLYKHHCNSPSGRERGKVYANIFTNISPMGDSIINFNQRIVVSTPFGPPTVAASAQITCMCVEDVTGTPVVLPEEQRNRLFN